MRTRFAVLVALGTLLAMSPQSWALTAQEKLLARNAAEVDAYAKLAKEVKGLWIDGIDVVRNFVTEESVRNVRFEAFVRGARIVRADAHPDGMAEVEMEITIEEFVRNVEELQKTVYKGKKKYEFIKVREIAQQRTVRVTGFGAPPAAADAAGEDAASVRTGADDFARKAFATLGNRYTAQEKLMGKNAAEVDAMGKLAKEVKGLWIDGIDIVKNFVTEESVRNVKFDAFIRGARFVDFDVSGDGMVSATAQITLTQVLRNVEKIVKSKRKHGEDIVTKVTTKVTEEHIPVVITVVGYGAMSGGGSGAPAPAPAPAGSVQ